MRPIRIAHVTATFPPYYGGTGNVCYHNARVLAARGHAVEVFTAAWPGPADDPAAVRVHRLPPVARIGNALLLPGLIPALRGFDVAHLHHPFIGGGDLAAALGGLRRIPRVVSYHNDLRAPGLRGALFAVYERTTARAILASASRVGVVTKGYADASPLLQPLVRAASPRLVELPNGVDATAFRPDVDGGPVRDRQRIPAGAFVVLFAGALDTAHHFKRVDLLMHAIRATSDLEIWGLVVGGGDRLAGYQTLAADLGLGDRVRFTGPVRHGDLPPYFAAADLVVLPSDGTESFGVVLIEAMASGRPVVATDLPGVRDIVSPGRDGLLVRPGDEEALAEAIREMANMPLAARRAFGAAGRSKVESRYAWERIGEELESLYTEVLAEQAASRHGTKRFARGFSPGGRSAQSWKDFVALSAGINFRAARPAAVPENPDQSVLLESSNAPRAGADLPISLRTALDLTITHGGGQSGTLRARIIGRAGLIAALAAYATIVEDDGALIALDAPPEQLRAVVGATSPSRVLTITAGALARPLRPLVAAGAATMPDLDGETWRALGYQPVGKRGVQGAGALAWAVAERVLRRVARPDLADRCRIAMLRTLVTTRLAANLATVVVSVYRRSG